MPRMHRHPSNAKEHRQSEMPGGDKSESYENREEGGSHLDQLGRFLLKEPPLDSTDGLKISSGSQGVSIVIIMLIPQGYSD